MLIRGLTLWLVSVGRRDVGATTRQIRAFTKNAKEEEEEEERTHFRLTFVAMTFYSATHGKPKQRFILSRCGALAPFAARLAHKFPYVKQPRHLKSSTAEKAARLVRLVPLVSLSVCKQNAGTRESANGAESGTALGERRERPESVSSVSSTLSRRERAAHYA